MQEFEWNELIDGESEINAEDINRLAEYAKALNNNKPDASDVTALLSGKVDKEDGKGLSSNDFTNGYKKKLDSSTFDDVFEIDGDFDTVEDMLNSESFMFITSTGIKRLQYNINGFSVQHGILLIGYKNEEYDELYALFYANDGTVWTTSTAEDWGIILDWQKISVSQTDLAKAIGDIETSLENIIQKYGLGGDAQ